MVAKVIDASAAGALLFGEPRCDEVSDWLRDATLIAPALLAYEIAYICIKKIRRDPEGRDGLVTAFARLGHMTIDIVEVDDITVTTTSISPPRLRFSASNSVLFP